MPWCPNCRLEYVKGIKVCPDCKTALVETLKEAEEISRLEDELNEASEYDAEYSNNEPVDDDEEETDKITASEAIKEITTLLRQRGVPEEEIKCVIENARRRATNSVPRYDSYEDKYKDRISSGTTLATVGSIGVIAIVLCLTGIIRLPMQGFSYWLTIGVMSFLFLVFVVSGYKALFTSKPLAALVDTEKEKAAEIAEFLKQEKKNGRFDIDNSDMSMEEESLFLSNMAVADVENNFEDLEPGFSYYVVDNYYSEIFESDED